MKFLKDEKAQGALEYLLIIGGSIVLAAVVIAIVINLGKKGGSDVNSQTEVYTNTLKSGKNAIPEIEQ